jgi:hypothetical protein
MVESVDASVGRFVSLLRKSYRTVSGGILRSFGLTIKGFAVIANPPFYSIGKRFAAGNL